MKATRMSGRARCSGGDPVLRLRFCADRSLKNRLRQTRLSNFQAHDDFSSISNPCIAEPGLLEVLPTRVLVLSFAVCE